MSRWADLQRSLRETALWYGGKAAHATYRAGIPGLSPWARSKLSARSYGRDLVPVDELSVAYGAALDWLASALRGGSVTGAYLEFGVCTGSSMLALQRAVVGRADAALHFVGFDSFEGLPDDAPGQDDGVWKAGSFMSDRDRTERRLLAAGIEAELIVGWFSDTLNDDTRASLNLSSAPLIMVDCDIYSAAVEALAFIRPHITGPTVIVFDDWYACGLADKGLGEARAWAEFAAANPDIVQVQEFAAYNDHSHIIGVDLVDAPVTVGTQLAEQSPR